MITNEPPAGNNHFIAWLFEHRALARMIADIIAVVILVAVLGIILKNYQDSNNSKIRVIVAQQQVIIKRQQKLLVNGCVRLNVKQAEDNRNQYADYTFDTIFVALLIHNPAPHQTSKQKKELSDFLAPLRAAGKAKSWVPLVPDCSTVKTTYRPPPTIAFHTALPPSAELRYP